MSPTSERKYNAIITTHDGKQDLFAHTTEEFVDTLRSFTEDAHVTVSVDDFLALMGHAFMEGIENQELSDDVSLEDMKEAMREVLREQLPLHIPVYPPVPASLSVYFCPHCKTTVPTNFHLCTHTITSGGTDPAP